MLRPPPKSPLFPYTTLFRSPPAVPSSDPAWARVFSTTRPEIGEDLRREGRGSSAADAPEHLPGTLTLLRLPAIQGVDEQIGVHHITGGHPLKHPHARSS